MWEENFLRQISEESLHSHHREPASFLDGVEKGLQVAEEIASWLQGQDQAAALRQIERERERIRGST